MFKRDVHTVLKRLMRGFPIIALTGPRQSGKTTLARMAFPDKPYLSLEDPDIRSLAEEDPRGLLSRFPNGAVLDEVQRAPQIFSYLQTHIDANMKPGLFVLTGSQQFNLLSGISQSLAGRVGMVQLLRFSISELKAAKHLSGSLDKLLFKGFYPPIYDRNLKPGDWFPSYMTTYIERDVRQLINVRDLSAFQRFVKMCAARVGQLLNLSSLSADCGITHNTASAWISVLEASYILWLLRPHHRNFNKRLVKSPKLYFVDVGFAAWLLGIREPEQISFHSYRGVLFENFVITELLKERFNKGLEPNLFFWRDSKGLEIDLIFEKEGDLKPVEIKLGQTIVPEFMAGLEKWSTLAGNPNCPATLIYGGDRELVKGNVDILPWKKLTSLSGKLL